MRGRRKPASYVFKKIIETEPGSDPISTHLAARVEARSPLLETSIVSTVLSFCFSVTFRCRDRASFVNVQYQYGVFCFFEFTFEY